MKLSKPFLRTGLIGVVWVEGMEGNRILRKERFWHRRGRTASCFYHFTLYLWNFTSAIFRKGKRYIFFCKTLRYLENWPTKG